MNPAPTPLATSIFPELPNTTPPPDMDDPLSPREIELLELCEETFRDARQCPFDVGEALLVVNQGRLYRANFTRFDDYHRRKWNYARSHAYRLMGAARVMRLLAPLGADALPESEYQVRPLVRLLENHAREIPALWKEMLEEYDGYDLTADRIRRFFNARFPMPPKPPRQKAPGGLPPEFLPNLQKAVHQTFDRLLEVILAEPHRAMAASLREQLIEHCIALSRASTPAANPASSGSASTSPSTHDAPSDTAKSTTTTRQPSTPPASTKTSPIGELSNRGATSSDPIPAPATSAPILTSGAELSPTGEIIPKAAGTPITPAPAASLPNRASAAQTSPIGEPARTLNPDATASRPSTAPHPATAHQIRQQRAPSNPAPAPTAKTSPIGEVHAASNHMNAAPRPPGAPPTITANQANQARLGVNPTPASAVQTSPIGEPARSTSSRSPGDTPALTNPSPSTQLTTEKIRHIMARRAQILAEMQAPPPQSQARR